MILRNVRNRIGGIRWGLVALLFGLPLPLVILAFMPGCR